MTIHWKPRLPQNCATDSEREVSDAQFAELAAVRLAWPSRVCRADS
jgi:hypothetical protein